jgi:two-component system response regulator GlrR
LLESELFGYVKGAFTDARENKPGLFARAHGGTLFIDEVGDAPLSIQTKLLRVLQEREILPLGGTQPIRVDVRIVAATHRSLKEEVAAGRFRQDLYFRLHVFPIRVPPLRERPKDISLLASAFAERLAEEMGVPFRGFTQTALNALETYSWPGNVRELQNKVERAIALQAGGLLTAKSLFPEQAFGPEPEPELEIKDTPPSSAPETLPSYSEAKQDFERTYLERVLTAARGNIAKAARLASKSRTEVYGLLRKHRLNPSTFKGKASGGSDS